jgi:sugar phosphate permease
MKSFVNLLFGDKQVPIVFRVYGWLFMILSLLFWGFWALPEIDYWILPYFNENSIFPERNLVDFFIGLFIGGIFPITASILLFKLGQGLVSGERMAFYGILALGIIAVLFELVIFLSTSLENNYIYYIGLTIIGITFIIYLPLLLIGLKHWNQLNR